MDFFKVVGWWYWALGPFRASHLHLLYKDLCTLISIYDYRLFSLIVNMVSEQ